MSSSVFLLQIGERFHPGTQEQFNRYAAHLGWLIRNDSVEALETLARIYRFRNVYELEQVLKRPGTPGPFDDTVPLEALGTEEMRSAISERNARAMQIIADRISAGHGGGQLNFTIQQLAALQLFSSPLTHEAAFSTLRGPRSTIPLECFALAH